MAKIKKKYFGITLLTLLVISSVCFLVIPLASTSEVTNDYAAKGLVFLNQVAGYNSTRYTATTTLATTGSLIDAVTTENIRYTLESANSHVEVLETFANGNLKMFMVLENDASFQLSAKPIFAAQMAKTFLTNYQVYSTDSFYGQLASMLQKAEITKNSTTTSGNIKFDITITSGQINSTTFTWSYFSNGINTLDKCVSLKYQDGFLTLFTDTWNLHKIGNTTVNISEKQAEELATKNAKAYTWTIGSGNQTVAVNNFNVTKPMVEELTFMQAGSTRDSDPLALYPVWHIGVGLDKYYPGNVYGIYIDIWADTGQIKDVYEVFSTLPPETSDIASIADSSIGDQAIIDTYLDTFYADSTVSLPIVLLLVVAIGGFAIVLFTKKTPMYSMRLPKIRKVGTTVLCIMISSVAFVSLASAIPTANAEVANIWGETAAGGGYLYHTTSEISAQTQLSSNISSWYSNAGYTSNNYQPYGQTTKSNVLAYANDAVSNVYFDHGIGTPGGNGDLYPYDDEWHYQLCTDLTTYASPSQNVFDYQLYDTTSAGTQYFSYISTCHSASLYGGLDPHHNPSETFSSTGYYGENSGGGAIIGMPYAWTHGDSMSTQGKYCYIGFVEGSASLCQDVDNRQGGYNTYGMFVYYYFDGLLNQHLTVWQALNYGASNAFPTQTWNDCMISDWFTASWPLEGGGNGTGWGKMVAYGNLGMYVYPGRPDYVIVSSISGPTSGTINNAYQ